jgi:hypothetical protein
MFKQHLTALLRSAGALFGIAGILVLGGCGGGNGAPNNPYLPPPPVIGDMFVVPGFATIYPGTPFTLTLIGGVPPYRAYTTDATVLPVPTNVSGDTIVVLANPVEVATTVRVGIQDSRGVVGTHDGVLTVMPAPLLPSGITIQGNSTPGCGSTNNTVCSGGTGTATVKVLGNASVPIPGRTLRFDVVQGNFQIVSNNPAQPLVTTLTTTTDINGNAAVILSVPADTPTQTGVLRVTDITTGQQINGVFDILQVTIDGAVLSVLPLGTTTINGPDNAHCSSGVSVNYYIFGGTPPYKVQTNFPQAIILTGVPVTKSGGTFVATTNGQCFVNLTFVITDNNGVTIPAGQYPLITNQLGTGAPTPPLTPLVVTPGAIAKNNCVPANTFQFIATGGTTPYSAVITSSTSSTTGTVAPQTNIAQAQAVTVSGLTSPSTTVITLFDNSSPRQSSTVTIDCSGQPTPPPPSALVVSPANYSYASNTCVGKTSLFTITGGTPGYTVFVTSGQTGATITQTGSSFTVTGLADTAATTNIAVVDAGTPQLQQAVSITCPTIGAMVVNPAAGYAYSSTATAPAPTCASATSTFTIVGGTPPYNVSFSIAGTPGTITPTTVTTSGGGFSVTNLSNNPQVNQLTIRDSSPSVQTLIRTITCNP